MRTVAIFVILFSVWGWISSYSVSAQSASDTAYHLAVLQMQEGNPAESFLGRQSWPPQAMVSEFQWILEGLQNRCLNPLDTISATIMETWRKLKQTKQEITLLDVSRDLYQVSRDTRLFGTDRINFRMISEFWLISQLSGHTIEDVLASYLASKK